MTNNIVSRAIKWNSERYDQEFDYSLSLSLLDEENTELLTAIDKANPIEIMDAVGDITFVAIGILWKLKVDTIIIEEIFYYYDLDNFKNVNPIDVVDHFKSKLRYLLKDDNERQIAYFCLTSIFLVSFKVLPVLGVANRYYDIVLAICDSNDTKEVKGKTAPNVKANINKGSNYIPPTKRLIEIYEDRTK